jgi:hypothetical protein
MFKALSGAERRKWRSWNFCDLLRIGSTSIYRTRKPTYIQAWNPTIIAQKIRIGKY